MMEKVYDANTFVRIDKAAKYQISYSLYLTGENFCGLFQFFVSQKTYFLHLFWKWQMLQLFIRGIKDPEGGFSKKGSVTSSYF